MLTTLRYLWIWGLVLLSHVMLLNRSPFRPSYIGQPFLLSQLPCLVYTRLFNITWWLSQEFYATENQGATLVIESHCDWKRFEYSVNSQSGSWLYATLPSKAVGLTSTMNTYWRIGLVVLDQHSSTLCICDYNGNSKQNSLTSLCIPSRSRPLNCRNDSIHLLAHIAPLATVEEDVH